MIELKVKIGEPLVDVLVRIGFAKSKREARYLIEAGAVSLRTIPKPLAEDETLR